MSGRDAAMQLALLMFATCCSNGSRAEPGGPSAAGAAGTSTGAGPSAGASGNVDGSGGVMNGVAGGSAAGDGGAIVAAGATAGGNVGTSGASAGASGAPSCAAGVFAWPRDAVAAVSLTYDDGLASQLDHAVPVLDESGLTATFFLSGSFAANAPRYTPLIAKGHELASHTIKHPCDPDLAAYTAASLATELDAGLAGVQALGATGRLTFAYPCGQSKYGAPAVSYVPLVKERFAAARGTTWSVANPQTVDLFDVPSAFPPETSDGSDFIELVKSAEATGGWAVLGVHGVSATGEYLKLSQPAHDSIVKYLKDNSDKLWIAPFGAVAAHVAACRQP
jgi:peptidoglycan/xylan/chitin deacetylase (PgdA/CDA1 family)